MSVSVPNISSLQFMDMKTPFVMVLDEVISKSKDVSLVWKLTTNIEEIDDQKKKLQLNKQIPVIVELSTALLSKGGDQADKQQVMNRRANMKKALKDVETTTASISKLTSEYKADRSQQTNDKLVKACKSGVAKDPNGKA